MHWLTQMTLVTQEPAPRWMPRTEVFTVGDLQLAALAESIPQIGLLLGVDHATAWRWPLLFQNRGDIEKVEKGSRSTRRASRWRYRAD